MDKRKRSTTFAFELLESRQLLAADLVISEFVARGSSLQDEDGTGNDWIEVFNLGDSAANLDGWALTDEQDSLDKWQFPDRTIDPGEALVVFASGKDRLGSQLHTNFRLASGGEYLALANPDGVVVSEFAPQFPRQIDQVSFGVPMQKAISAPTLPPNADISASLVSHFDFEDPTRLGNDRGTYDNNARVVANAQFSSNAAIGNGALSLDGEGSFLEIPNSGADYSSLDDDGDGFTLAAWVNVDSGVDGNRRLFSMDMEGGPFKSRGWGVGFRDRNTLLATTYGRVDFDEPSQAAIEDGEWRHLAYVYEPSKGTVEFFIDGVSTGIETGSPVGMNNATATDDFLIGALNLTSSGNGQFFGGLIDDVRIYDGPLSQTEVASLMTLNPDTTSSLQYLIPSDDTVDSFWMNPDFDDSDWKSASAALGYETSPGSFANMIHHQVPTGTTSVYLRKSFNLEDANDVSHLQLRMLYDDGFAAYLNGQLVASSNAPETLSYNSVATVDRMNSQASSWTSFDLSAFTDHLANGNNFIAIHALNDDANSDEFLVVPELLVASSDQFLYLDALTPGEANSLGNEFGPLIQDVRHSPAIPSKDDPLTVTARITELAAPIDTITLHYRSMYGVESTRLMNDAGLDADLVAGDGVYTAVIPAATSAPGQMIRYYITSNDAFDREFRAPYLPDQTDPTGFPEYFGTVVSDSTVETSLPVLQWFVPDPTWHMRSPDRPASGNNRDWTSASAYFDGEFYDNIAVRVRGSATVQGWPKPKFKFEFNDVHEFRYADDQERVDEFNLQSHYIEVLPNAGLGSTAVSYMRETLAYQFLQEIGAPASTAFHMRVQQNGEFYSLASFIEQVDRTFLRRNGFADDGPMYKATPTVQSTLAPNPNPGIYRKVTQKDEPFDDLRELTDGINGRIDGVSVEEYIFDHINLPQVINLMAGQTILMNHDRLTKNYYVHLDPQSGEWSRFPWDVEQAFSDPRWEHFVSVLYGDSEHTQGTGNEPQYPNHLLDAILDTPRTRQMYLERVRTLMDNYLGDGPGYFENRIDELAALITADANLDHGRWRAGRIADGVASIKENLQKRREVLASDPLVPRKDSVVRNVALVPENAQVSILIPSSPEDGIVDGVSWHLAGATFPDDVANGWTKGMTGIGYDRRTGYEPWIELDIRSLLDPDGDGENTTNSVYARMEFDVADPTEFDFLDLEMRYDDGFVAYLNGHEVARDRVPDVVTWDARATRGREAGDTFDRFGVTTTLDDGTPLLVEGTNVLAIHALNRSLTDSDMLVQPRLVGGIFEPRVFSIRFGEVDTDGVEEPNETVVNPVSGNQAEEYISIINDGNATIDMSGWRITGGVEAVFQPGTALPANSTLYVSPDVNAFRARQTGPSGAQSLFVQASDRGRLSNFGETITLIDNSDNVIATLVTPSMTSEAQRYLRISEIHYNPPGGDDVSEFIEFVNISQGPDATTLELSGVTLSDGPSEPFEFPDGLSLASGERIVIVRDIEGFRATYPLVQEDRIAGTYQGRLSNNGELLKLDDADGATVIEFSYDDTLFWPKAADGIGATLSLIDDSVDRDSFGDASVWRSSTARGGTPTADNDLPLGVIINEVLVHSPGIVEQPDAIELYNSTSQSIDLSGWYLSNSSDQLLKYRIPNGTSISAGGYLVFDSRQFNPNPDAPGQSDFALMDGDSVWLVKANQQNIVSDFADQISISTLQNTSLGRVADSSGPFVPQTRVSLGSENRFALTGPLVISEVNYNPGIVSADALQIDPTLNSGRLEYVEIHNPTLTPVVLTGWRLSGGIDYAFAQNEMLDAGQSLLVLSFNPSDPDNANRVRGFQTHYGIDPDMRFVGGYSGRLSNGGDVVQLVAPNVEPLRAEDLYVDAVAYDDNLPWPEAAGNGLSIQRSSVLSNGFSPNSWSAAIPTPGVANIIDLTRGDTTGDGRLSADDIDLFFDAIHNGHRIPALDFNDDGSVDLEDGDAFVTGVFKTSTGDVNLDGIFNSRDLVLIFQRGEYEDQLVNNSRWTDGDWNGDGEFSTADLVKAFQEGKYRTD